MKNVKKVEIILEGKEWTSILDTVFKKKQKEIKIDGFRKGAVTKEVFLKKVGQEALYPDAIDASLNIAYKKALDEHKLIPVVEPAVDVKDISDKHIKFEFTIITKPEVKLGTYKKLKVKREEPTVTKEEIDTEIKNLQSRLAEISIKDKGPIEIGNTAVIDFEGLVDGEKLEGGSGADFPLEIGSNSFIPGFEEGLIGLKKGDKKTLNLKFPDNYTPELKNKDVEFRVTIKEIKERILPEIGKELYEDLGFKNIKTENEFRKEVEASLKEKKAASIEDAYIEACLEKAAANMKVEINPEILSEELHRMCQQYEQQLQMQGVTLDQYLEFANQTHDDLHKQMEPEALKRVKYRYLIEEVAKAEKIEVTDADTEAEIKVQSEKYNVPKEEFLQMIGGPDMMKYDIQMRRAVDIIKE